MTARTLSAGRATILYDDTLVSHADAALFDPPVRAAAVGGRGSAWIVPGADGSEWVLRHYRRGGLPARLVEDTYLWTGLGYTRPWREWHLLAELHALGLPVPRPVAARSTRSGIVYHGDLITRRIPDARSLAELLAPGAAIPIPWPAIGGCIRRFHEAGVWHADLNAHNILVDGTGGVWLIDFDRGERRSGGAAWKPENLARLKRSLYKSVLPEAVIAQGWAALLDGYATRA
jgi:3-deoxy-D-manno-octulosonic acid kinase